MTKHSSFACDSAKRRAARAGALLGFLLLTLSSWTGRAWAVPALPLINTNYVLNVTNFGAVGDGVATNTAAIQNAINAAALGGTTNGAAGGTVQFPAGVFLSGPLTLKSSVNLQLSSGAILRMLPFGKYPVTWITNGTDVYFTANNFISGTSLHDIAISGPGAIEGQGEPWWPWADTNNAVRPIMIRLSGCNRELIQNVTLSNSPMFHISLTGSAGNSTVQGVTILANPSSDPLNPGHNTDACDVAGTNILIQNCNISVGDDNFTCGGNTSDVLITNCTYGYGHGVSIGSYTSPSVSNITVINCTFNNTDQGIRIKSDRDRGGLVQNISYYNLSMTNVTHPILIYTEYTNTTSAYRSLDNISPNVAASYPTSAVTTTTPRYRNITISNVTATAQSSRGAGLIWGLPEMAISNVTLIKVKITADKPFAIHQTRGVQLVDCQIISPAGVTNIWFYNTGLTLTNSTPSSNVVLMDGSSANGIGNPLSFYNAKAWLKNTNALDDSPGITLGGSTLTVSNHLVLDTNSFVNFVLGTNASTLVVVSNLTEIGIINASAGAGFTNGVFTLFTYGKNLLGWGPPTLGSAPTGYNFSFDTNTAGQIKLVAALSVSLPPPPTNLTAWATNSLVTLSWSPVPAAAGYNVKRSTNSGGAYATIAASITTTNYTDTQVTNGTTYYYVVSSTNGAGEGADSVQASATPQSPAFSVVTRTVFNDAFSTSTLNSLSPVAPTATATSYEMISSKAWSPTPSIAAGHLQFGIAATGSGSVEVQALFTNSPVTLATLGDSLSLTVTFTNTSGLLTTTNALAFGLYRSGQNFPVPGGLNATATTNSSGNTTGNAQTWAGYVGQIGFTGNSSQIMTRAAQTGIANNNQDAVTTGSSSSSYNNPAAATVGTASLTPSVTLTTGNPYTEVLRITLTAANTLAITNCLYSGTDSNGVLLSQFGGIASGATYLTNAFDALAVGWRATSSSAATAIDINKIIVTSTLTVPTTIPNPVSLTPPSLVFQNAGNQLQLSWPSDHTGWRLQIQTNALSSGLGTNWVNVANSDVTNAVTVPVNPTNNSVFLRLIYP